MLHQILKKFSPLHLQDRNTVLYSLPRLYKLIYFCVSCPAQKRREKTSCSTTYVRPIIYYAHNYTSRNNARLILSRQHRSYLLVPGVLEVPGDPLFHLYRPYLKKNKNIIELLYFNAKEKLATKTSNLFFNIYTNRVAKLCCASTTHVQTCLATNQADSCVVISCPIGACLITICIPFLTLANKETEWYI